MTTITKQHCPGCFQPKGDAAKCPHCGYDESAERDPIFLPHRTRLRGVALAPHDIIVNAIIFCDIGCGGPLRGRGRHMGLPRPAHAEHHPPYR